MAHLDIEFPRDIAAGCQAVLERRDEVVRLASGYEETNQRWTHARRSWNAGLGLRSEADLARVVEVFEEVRGRANSFRFRDWLDWRSAPVSQPISATDQTLGTGDGTKTDFQLVKKYGAVNPYLRPIALPNIATLTLAIDGAPAPTGWSLVPVGGLVVFDTPPPPSSTITAGFTFEVPVRFDQSSLSLEWAYFTESGGSGAVPDITLIEKRLDSGITP
ncbi:DUF2460 domain-containing protein [Roseobacter litoralis]|uniref:DUF2460 domain-containing protein n=1 Tax=Roseobacter litoralis TaxID=42443 RepID=UPI00249583E6|nr:DUF2460 domain-containing protein [Roseobacter litoralis]